METSQRQLDYIFWNLFRVDSDYNRQVDFQEFAPFILSHAGQISLQRFHKEQIKGKNFLSYSQLYSVLNGAYHLLVFNAKKQAVDLIFQRIKKDQLVSYGSFLSLVRGSLSRRFR